MRERGEKSTSWRRRWLLPLLAIAGRRLAVYLALYPVHLALAGLTLAFIAIKARTGDADWIFWLSYAWIALQVVVRHRLFVPSALALAFVALQATQADRDAIFWLCLRVAVDDGSRRRRPDSGNEVAATSGPSARPGRGDK